MQTSYVNPWFSKSGNDPQIYRTDAKPTQYRGYQIFERLHGVCWDVVKDGVCRTQRAGKSGAIGYVDAVLDHPKSCDCHYCAINRVHHPELHK